MGDILAPAKAVLHGARETDDIPGERSTISPYHRALWENDDYNSRHPKLFSDLIIPNNFFLLNHFLRSPLLPRFNTGHHRQNLPLSTFSDTLKAARISREKRNSRARLSLLRATSRSAYDRSGDSATASSEKSRSGTFKPKIINKAHENRTKQLLEILTPILSPGNSEESCILLCWGKPAKCHVIPIMVPNSMNEKAMWQEISKVWDKSREWWRSLVPKFGVREVQFAEVRSFKTNLRRQLWLIKC
jgi:hypothetical protein